MTDRAETVPSRDELRDEAATWFAVMRGPSAEMRRAEFEAWLTRGPRNREAYNRVAETFSLGKALRYEDLSPPCDCPAKPGPAGAAERTRRLVTALVIVLALGSLSLAWLRSGAGASWVGSPPRALSTPGADTLRLATRMGEIRSFHLADGSVATLDTDSLILARFTDGERRLTLARGRARFEVAHERRRFVVGAESGSVTAVGTVFDVALGSQGRVNVRLLKGVVDVEIGAGSAAGSSSRRLAAGQILSFGGGAAPAAAKIASAPDANWPTGLRDFNGVRLADVLAEANRYAALKLRAAEPSIADLRISGTFRIDNSRQLAANIAEVLGLAEISDDSGIVLIRSCPTSAKENCVPAS